MRSDAFSTTCPSRAQAADLVLVAAEREPLVQGAVELALEFADAPAVLRSLDLVESAGLGVGYRQQG